MSYGKFKTTSNLFNCNKPGHRERLRELKGLDIDVDPDPSTVTGGTNLVSIISCIRSNEEKTQALLRFVIMIDDSPAPFGEFQPFIHFSFLLRYS